MGRHFFPRADVDFLAWGTRFVGTVRSQSSKMGIEARDAHQLTRAWEQFRAAYTDHVDAHKVAAESFKRKQALRKDFEAVIRSLVRDIQQNEATSDRHRAELGITVPRRRRQRRRLPSQSRPLLRVDASDSLAHTIRFQDESTPDQRRRPDGAKCAEIWAAVVTAGQPMPPKPESADSRGPFKCMAHPMRSPVRLSFTPVQAGKSVFYLMRWVGKSGELGEWSDAANASISP